MIRKMTVSNYRSLGEKVVVDLGNFTALVGTNGSGKSTVCDVLAFVAQALRHSLGSAIESRNGLTAVRRFSDGRPFDISIRLEVSSRSGTGYYEVVITAADNVPRVKVEEAAWTVSGDEAPAVFRIESGEWKIAPGVIQPQIDKGSLVLSAVAGDKRFKPLYDNLVTTTIYNISPATLRDPKKPNPTRPMEERGENWGSILAETLKSAARADLIEAMNRVTGDIDDVRVTPLGGYLLVQFRHGTSSSKDKKKARWFDAFQESDGTLRMAGILTALLQSPLPGVVGIEEPELTIHPGGLKLLTEYLRQAARQTQLILTTHSPDILDHLEADEIRVVHREGGATRVSKMATDQKDAVIQRLRTLGEVLRYEGLRSEGQAELFVSEEP